MRTMARIDLNNVRKVYSGNVTAIHGVNLAIEDGQMVVLVGPSGCGKSTLLRMIAGLETITDGTISIGNEVVNTKEPAERDIAMVFQNYALYPHMTVRQNLEYGLKNRNTPRDEIAARVAEAARILEITPFLDRKPRQLSGGQRQRVAMGRAIVRQPRAFLFDEPLSNLDAKLRGQMRVEIRRLQRALSTTSVYVTHDQLEAMTLADQLVVMNAGRVEQVGSPTEIYDRPETLFVAGFIGSPPMNLIPVDAVSDRNSLGVLPENTDILGVRPDTLTLDAPTEPSIAFDVSIELFEPVGGESHVYVRLSTGQTLVLSVQGRPQMREGDQIRIYAAISRLHPFNSASGKRTD
jgi:sn-glycerol 3-phosphate transport system ATP-binding protein